MRLKVKGIRRKWHKDRLCGWASILFEDVGLLISDVYVSANRDLTRIDFDFPEKTYSNANFTKGKIPFIQFLRHGDRHKFEDALVEALREYQGKENSEEP